MNGLRRKKNSEKKKISCEKERKAFIEENKKQKIF